MAFLGGGGLGRGRWGLALWQIPGKLWTAL